MISSSLSSVPRRITVPQSNFAAGKSGKSGYNRIALTKMSHVNRILLSDKAHFDCKALIIWEDVRCVDIVSNCVETCPICLDDVCLPQILECGHVFCLVCILLHLTTACSCCVCNQYGRASDLRLARFQLVSSVKIGTSRSFQLVRTDLDIGVTLPFGVDICSLPYQSVVGWWFSKFAIISDVELLSLHTNEKRFVLDVMAIDGPLSEGVYGLSNGLALDFLDSRIDSLILIEEDVCTSNDHLNISPVKYVSPEFSTLPTHENESMRNQSGVFSYQLVDGQAVYLEPVWMRALNLHFCKNPDAWDTPILLPLSISLPIVFTSTFCLDVYNRLRYRQLNHLPVGTHVTLCDVDLRGVVDSHVFEQLADSIERRLQVIKRVKLQKKLDKRDVLKAKSVPLSKEWTSGQFIIQPTNNKIPTDEDFPATLPAPITQNPTPYEPRITQLTGGRPTKKGIKFTLAG